MSERDAFGRERDEDTLAAMGWREPTFTATIAGAAERRPSSPPETARCRRVKPPRGGRATWSPSRRRPALVERPDRRRRGPRVMTRLLFLGIVAAAILFALRAGTTYSATSRTRSGAGLEPSRGPSRRGRLLLRASALEAALEGLPAATSRSLRVAPDRLDAQVIVDGRMHNVRVDGGRAGVRPPDARRRPRRAGAASMRARRPGSSGPPRAGRDGARGASPTSS